MTILALPEASLHCVEMKQPKKKPAVPGCSNWISAVSNWNHIFIKQHLETVMA